MVIFWSSSNHEWQTRRRPSVLLGGQTEDRFCVCDNKTPPVVNHLESRGEIWWDVVEVRYEE